MGADLTPMNLSLQSAIFVVSLLLPVAAAKASPAAGSKDKPKEKEGKKQKIVHRVKKGDTLIKIAGRYNVEVESIMDWNKDIFQKKEEKEPKGEKVTEDSYPSVILPGTKLKIPKKGPDGKAITYKVKGGDTFISIARQFDVTKAKLYKWNKSTLNPGGSGGGPKTGGGAKKKCTEGKKGKKGKKGKGACEEYDTDTIIPDMELVIYAVRPDLGPRIGVYCARAGDTPLTVAKKFKVDLGDLLDYNFLDKADTLGKDEIVEVPLAVANKPSQSVGTPSSGKLVNGEKLPVGPGYIIRSPEYAFATNETITHLVNCIADVHRTFPGTHDSVIGHLSKKFGGKFRPHKSHASGRDVDMGYYLKGMKPNKFIKITQANFDVEKSMHLIQCLVDTQELEYVFVSYYIQKIMYAHMQNKGKEEPFLSKLIQYPKPVEKRVAIIRHDKGHDDHMHIRFQCPKNSPTCSE